MYERRIIFLQKQNSNISSVANEGISSEEKQDVNDGLIKAKSDTEGGESNLSQNKTNHDPFVSPTDKAAISKGSLPVFDNPAVNDGHLKTNPLEIISQNNDKVVSDNKLWSSIKNIFSWIAKISLFALLFWGWVRRGNSNDSQDYIREDIRSKNDLRSLNTNVNSEFVKPSYTSVNRSHRTPITDPYGIPKGYLLDEGTGVIDVLDLLGRLKGRYNKKTDMTFDVSGVPIGKGNRLILLLDK